MRGLNPLTLLGLLLIIFSQTLALGLGHQNNQCSLQDDDTHSTFRVIHVLSPCSPLRPKTQVPSSWEETVATTLAEDEGRLNYLSTLLKGKKATVAPIAWGRMVLQTPTYLVRVKIGTPAQTFMMALDTSSDAAWLPCNGCLGCQGSSLFASDKSASFKGVPCATPQCQQVINPICTQNLCTFNQTYGGSTIAATLSQDTLTLAQDLVPDYVFGCISKTTGTSVPQQGLLGLGRGPLSLLSQTQNLYKATFSYCLPSFKSANFTGSLKLGPIAQPKRMQYTPLLMNPKRPSLYYVNLVGIKVGNKIVDIPPAALGFDPNTGAGTIIDSGTVYTRLVQPAYIAVRDEFRRRMGQAVITSLGGFETCYTVPVTVPSITLMFQGMNTTLAQDNFLLHSSSSSLTCLAIAPANDVLNVIANMQQQNHRVVFDVPNSRVGISREPCS
ncbi:hypothetical protein vseg_021158 [Gypsophila vaccaria]